MVYALVIWALMPNHFRERSTGRHPRRSWNLGVKLFRSCFARPNFWIDGPKRISLCWMPPSLCLVPCSNISRESFSYRKRGLNFCPPWSTALEMRPINRHVHIWICATCLPVPTSAAIPFQDVKTGTVLKRGNVCGFFTISRRRLARPKPLRPIDCSVVIVVISVLTQRGPLKCRRWWNDGWPSGHLGSDPTPLCLLWLFPGIRRLLAGNIIYPLSRQSCNSPIGWIVSPWEVVVIVVVVRKTLFVGHRLLTGNGSMAIEDHKAIALMLKKNIYYFALDRSFLVGSWNFLDEVEALNGSPVFS